MMVTVGLTTPPPVWRASPSAEAQEGPARAPDVSRVRQGELYLCAPVDPESTEGVGVCRALSNIQHFAFSPGKPKSIPGFSAETSLLRAPTFVCLGRWCLLSGGNPEEGTEWSLWFEIIDD